MRRRALASLVLLLAALPACAPAAPARTPASWSPADRLLRLYRGLHIDFEPADTPTALAARSDVVLLGKFREVREGKVRGASRDDPDRTEFLVYRIEVIELRKGTLPGGEVWVEDVKPGYTPAAVFDAALLREAPAVLHLTRADAQLTRFTNPQGFLVFAEGRVLAPMAGPSRPVFRAGDPDPGDPRGWLG